MEFQNLTSADVESVQNKLQAFYEDLPEGEKPVLETVLAHAANRGGPSPSAESGEDHSIIIVGGRAGGLKIPLNPGVLAGLNPQPIPPGKTPNDPDPAPIEGTELREP